MEGDAQEMKVREPEANNGMISVNINAMQHNGMQNCEQSGTCLPPNTFETRV